MSRLRAWTWKEAREHRWVILTVWLAVAVITMAPFVAFRAESTRVDLDRLPIVAIALATLVLGLDLFARETRRGTHALILRTPGALRWAFPAKLLLLLAGTLGALAIEEGLRHSLSALTGVPYPFRVTMVEGEWRRVPRSMEPETAFGIEMAVFGGLLAAAVGLWHVAGSVVSPRAGVGALCGALALGVLGTPLLILREHHPWWFQVPTGEAYAWIAAIGIAGLLVAGVAWFSGRRFLLPRKTAAIRGGLVAVVLAGVATGGVAYAVDRWEAVNSTAPEFRIESGFLGAGGKTLYLTTSRGGLYGDLHAESYRQSPPFAWSIALDDVTQGSKVHKAAYFELPRGAARMTPLVPVPYLVRIDEELPHRDPWTDRWTWIDTATDGVHATGGMSTLTAATIDAVRADAKAMTPLRDSKGRRVWWVEGAVERDGDEDRVPTPAASARREDVGLIVWRSGWLLHGYYGRDPDHPERALVRTDTWIDAETGTTHPRVDRRPDAPAEFTAKAKGFSTGGQTLHLGGSSYLLRSRAEPPSGPLDTGWLLWDSETPDRFTPAPGAPAGWDVEPVTPDTLLVPAEVGPLQRDGELAKTRLVLWKPLTGERTPVESADATLLSPGRLLGGAILPDGRRLLHLYERTGLLLGRQALAVFDLPTKTLVRVAPWAEGWWEPIAFDVDGSLLAIEGHRRVVRLSKEGTKFEIVWPK